jgi:AraC family transcriptional regulator of adaptative response / DNA-3-methyladenine glycosylase II
MDTVMGTDVLVGYAGPYDWPMMRAWLAGRALDGIESVREDGYARTLCLGGSPGVVDVTYAPDRSGFVVRVVTMASVGHEGIAARLVRVLDLDRDLVAMGRHLRHDPWLAGLLVRHAGLRVPGGWDPFELAVRAVLGQQVTIGAARHLASQLVTLCGRSLPEPLQRPGLGRLFPTARQVASADLGALRMPGSRRATLTALAHAVADDEGVLAKDASLDAMLARLRAIRGIGDWTAQYIALRALRHPDAFPASDIGLLRGAAREMGGRPTPAALQQRAEAWRPCRAYAAQLLWAEG